MPHFQMEDHALHFRMTENNNRIEENNSGSLSLPLTLTLNTLNITLNITREVEIESG